MAVDGSPDCEPALTRAVELADAADGRLTIFTPVVPVPRISVIGLGLVGALGLLRDAEEVADAVCRAARELVPRHISVTGVVRAGPGGRALVRQVEEGRHDLVVLGLARRARLRSALLDRGSRYVVRTSPASVLIVHADRCRAEGYALRAERDLQQAHVRGEIMAASFFALDPIGSSPTAQAGRPPRPPRPAGR